MFPQDNCPSVTQYGEVPELMAGIGLCERSGSMGDEVPGKKKSSYLLACTGEVETNLIGKFLIEDNGLRLADWSR